MATLNQIKQLAESDTPLLFFQCILPSGDTQYWSTHSITFAGQDYSARVCKAQFVRTPALGRRCNGWVIPTFAHARERGFEPF